MEQGINSRKGEKVRSYTISFKRSVVNFAETKSILAAALKHKLDRNSVRDWKKKRSSYKSFLTLYQKRKMFTRSRQKKIERGNGELVTRMDF